MGISKKLGNRRDKHAFQEVSLLRKFARYQFASTSTSLPTQIESISWHVDRFNDSFQKNDFVAKKQNFIYIYIYMA